MNEYINIDIDLENLTKWSKVYLTYLLVKENVEVYKTRKGYHIRKVPKIYEYLRGCIDDYWRIEFERFRPNSRKYVLFNRKITIRNGKVTSKYEEEEVGKDELLRNIY